MTSKIFILSIFLLSALSNPLFAQKNEVFVGFYVFKSQSLVVKKTLDYYRTINEHYAIGLKSFYALIESNQNEFFNPPITRRLNFDLVNKLVVHQSESLSFYSEFGVSFLHEFVSKSSSICGVLPDCFDYYWEDSFQHVPFLGLNAGMKMNIKITKRFNIGLNYSVNGYRNVGIKKEETYRFLHNPYLSFGILF